MGLPGWCSNKTHPVILSQVSPGNPNNNPAKDREQISLSQFYPNLNLQAGAYRPFWGWWALGGRPGDAGEAHSSLVPPEGWNHSPRSVKKPNNLLTLMVLSQLNTCLWPAAQTLTRQDRSPVVCGSSGKGFSYCSPGHCLHSPYLNPEKERHTWTFMTSALLVVPLKAQLDQKYLSQFLSTQIQSETQTSQSLSQKALTQLGKLVFHNSFKIHLLKLNYISSVAFSKKNCSTRFSSLNQKDKMQLYCM